MKPTSEDNNLIKRMSKRTATRELNHDNWDDDDEEEEAGTFQPASPEALNGRVIKQARRRLAGNDGEVTDFLLLSIE